MDHATNPFLEIPRGQGPQVRNPLARTLGTAPGEQACWGVPGRAPMWEPGGKNGGKGHISYPTYFIILLKNSPAAFYPVVNGEINDEKLILTFGEGNYGTQSLAMGGNKHKRRGRQCYRKKLFNLTPN